jgi:hypothetical protein
MTKEKTAMEGYERVIEYFRKEGFNPKLEVIFVTEKSPSEQKLIFFDWTFSEGKIYAPLFRLPSNLPLEYYEGKFGHEVSHSIFKEQILRLNENYRKVFEVPLFTINEIFCSEKMCDLKYREELQLQNKLIKMFGSEDILIKEIKSKEGRYWTDLVPREQFLEWRENLIRQMFSLLPTALREFFFQYSEIRGLDEDLAHAVESYFSKEDAEYNPSFLLYYLYNYMRVLKPERYSRLRGLLQEHGYKFLYESGIIKKEIENCLR